MSFSPLCVCACACWCVGTGAHACACARACVLVRVWVCACVSLSLSLWICLSAFHFSVTTTVDMRSSPLFQEMHPMIYQERKRVLEPDAQGAMVGMQSVVECPFGPF